MRTVYVVGDSTVETGSAPFFGWGGQLEPLLPEGWRVVNHAKGGRSTLSFWNEERFVPVEAAMRTGDLLLIGFGHNDEKDDAERHTDPWGSFQEMLLRYVRAARLVGAVPVLCTSVARRYFTGDGSLMYTHGEYPLAARTLAAQEGVPLIDLNALTRALLIDLGPEESASLFVNVEPGEYPSLPDGWHDQTHFNLHGAQTVAGLVARALREAGLLEGSDGHVDD